MSKVLAIAHNTFKEAVRNRILYVLLFFAALILLGSWVASTLSIANNEKVMRDLGVAGINIIGLLIAVFVGIGLVYNEMDKKTIYTIISKPISRWQFILGKYLGLLLTIFLNLLAMTWFFCAVLHLRQYLDTDAMVKALWHETAEGMMKGPSGFQIVWYYVESFSLSIGKATLNVGSLGAYYQPITQGLIMSTALITVELAVVTAFAVLYSTFSSPTLSAFLTVLTFVIGRMNSDLYEFAQTIIQKAGSIDNLASGEKLGYYLLMFVSHVAPNLEVFSLRPEISDMQATPFDPYAWAYGIIYSSAILLIAILAFNRRNFK